MRLRLAEDGAEFRTAPVQIETPNGPAVVTVTGSLSVTQEAAGGARLRVAMRREVTPGPGASFTAGYSSSGTVQAVPGPADVLSFEMPPLTINGSDLPDRLSLRLRLTPVE